MTDLERRALLGDREAQEECTEKGIVLPCPCCGSQGKILDLGEVYMVACGDCGASTRISSVKNVRPNLGTPEQRRRSDGVGRVHIKHPVSDGCTVALPMMIVVATISQRRHGNDRD